MNQVIQELFGDIRIMIDKHHQLLQLAEQQRIALVNGESDTLQVLLPQFEHAAAEIVEAEQHRIQVTSVLAKELGLAPMHANAPEFISVLDEEHGTQLRMLCQQLKDVVDKLVQANERNAMLTRFSIDYTHKILEMVAGVTNHDRYGSTKKMQAEPRILNLKA